jgi:hypothetical protein
LKSQNLDFKPKWMNEELSGHQSLQYGIKIWHFIDRVSIHAQKYSFCLLHQSKDWVWCYRITFLNFRGMISHSRGKRIFYSVSTWLITLIYFHFHDRGKNFSPPCCNCYGPLRWTALKLVSANTLTAISPLFL